MSEANVSMRHVSIDPTNNSSGVHSPVLPRNSGGLVTMNGGLSFEAKYTSLRPSHSVVVRYGKTLEAAVIMDASAAHVLSGGEIFTVPARTSKRDGAQCLELGHAFAEV